MFASFHSKGTIPFLEFELFKTRSNNYWTLWKTNNFALLHQHVCNNKYLHLATSSKRHSFASHWLVFHPMQPMSAPHCTTTRGPMLKFGGESVESGLTSTSSLSNSLMCKSCNSPSLVLPSISFRENVVHLVFGGWIYRTVNTPSHNLCASCDLTSKLNDVTGDELDIDISIALFRNQNHITLVSLLVWLFFICPHTDLVTVPPTESKPIHKLDISAWGHYCVKEVPAYFGFILKFPTTQVGK